MNVSQSNKQSDAYLEKGRLIIEIEDVNLYPCTGCLAFVIIKVDHLHRKLLLILLIKDLQPFFGDKHPPRFSLDPGFVADLLGLFAANAIIFNSTEDEALLQFQLKLDMSAFASMHQSVKDCILHKRLDDHGRDLHKLVINLIINLNGIIKFIIETQPDCILA